MQVPFAGLIELRDAIRTRSLTVTQLVRHHLDRIERHDGKLGCYREVFADESLARATSLDERIAAGDEIGPLGGMTIAVKDNIATEFGRTTCGSRILKRFESPYSATVVDQLLDAGAIIIGKTNCDEFAMGSSTEHCAFGQTRNPWDPSRVPGGSSGGSAAAVAADLCVAALGSDTGGSIRQPAAFCGVVGAKPTYGRVSRHGLVAFASSLDQIGPIARNVGDAALLLDAISGHDPRDSTSVEFLPTDLTLELEDPLQGLRIGVLRTGENDDNHPAINDAMHHATEVFESLGAIPVDIDMELTEYGIATYYVIAPAEASSNLARYDGIRYGERAEVGADESLEHLYARSRAEGFGPEVQRRIMLGTYVLSAGYYDAYYKRALQVRRLIRQEYERAFEKCDVVLGPTTPTPAFAIGEKADPLSMYLCDRYTVGANIAGICAVSIPAGLVDVDGNSLPLGLHLQGRGFDESTLFRAARMFEAATRHHEQRPPGVADD